MKLNIIDAEITFITYHYYADKYCIMTRRFDRIPNTQWLNNWKNQTEEYLSCANDDDVTLHVAHIVASDRNTLVKSEVYGQFHDLSIILETREEEVEN